MLAQSTCCDRCKINKRHTSKGSNKKKIKKRRRIKVIIFSADSPVFYVKEEKTRNVIPCKNDPA